MYVSAALVALLIPASGLEAAPTRHDAACTSATTVMTSWLAAWKAKDFKRMVQLSERSWRLRTPDAVGQLRDQYGFKDVLTYRFRHCTGNAVSARVTFRVDYKTFKRSRVQIAGMVIREDKQGHPSAIGQWGVNPISTLREDPL